MKKEGAPKDTLPFVLRIKNYWSSPASAFLIMFSFA